MDPQILHLQNGIKLQVSLLLFLGLDEETSPCHEIQPLPLALPPLEPNSLATQTPSTFLCYFSHLCLCSFSPFCLRKPFPNISPWPHPTHLLRATSGHLLRKLTMIGLPPFSTHNPTKTVTGPQGMSLSACCPLCGWVVCLPC